MSLPRKLEVIRLTAEVFALAFGVLLLDSSMSRK
jgi:hypothetical protein